MNLYNISLSQKQIAAGICRTESHQSVNPDTGTNGNEMDKEYVQQLHHFAMKIPTIRSKVSAPRGHKLFTKVRHEHTKNQMAAIHGYPNFVIAPKRNQKTSGRGDRSDDLVIKLSGDLDHCQDTRNGLRTARDIIIEDI